MKFFTQHEHKSSVDRLKKKGIMFLAVLVFGAALYIGLTSVNGDLITTSAVFPGNAPQSLFNVNADLQMDTIEMDVDDVTLNIVVESGGFTINGLTLESGAQVLLTQFDGTIEINDTLTLKGNAQSAIVDAVILSGKKVKIEAENIEFSSIELTNIDLPLFSMDSYGTVNVAERGTFSVNGERLEIRPLKGTITLNSGTMQISGETNRVQIASSPAIVIS
ncbi:MAG TPA: hypothetical protein VJB66_01365 [Candidatus Nanoarchaeia archaeon]|nr:hypothetical protein [Candidatus Nanoarchaeia archaeon]